MNTKIFVALITIVVSGLVGLVLLKPAAPYQPQPHLSSQGVSHNLVVYKSPTCGCCSHWVTYMKSKGYQVDVVDTDDMDAIKDRYRVPNQLEACHTTIVNDGQYFIEGHIPEEAVARLLETEPDLQGIGMPGMPQASPGMPGVKTTPFDISQVHLNGQIDNFMSI